MPKPSRYTDRFAQLQQHYEATEPKWMVKQREEAKAVADVMAALNPRPPLSTYDEIVLAALMGKPMIIPEIQDLVTDAKRAIDRAAGTKFNAYKILTADIEAFNGYSRSPTGRVRK